MSVQVIHVLGILFVVVMILLLTFVYARSSALFTYEKIAHHLTVRLGVYWPYTLLGISVMLFVILLAFVLKTPYGRFDVPPYLLIRFQFLMLALAICVAVFIVGLFVYVYVYKQGDLGNPVQLLPTGLLEEQEARVQVLYNTGLVVLTLFIVVFVLGFVRNKMT